MVANYAPALLLLAASHALCPAANGAGGAGGAATIVNVKRTDLTFLPNQLQVLPMEINLPGDQTFQVSDIRSSCMGTCIDLNCVSPDSSLYSGM